MVPRLWVPLIHWLWARNWNLAASGAGLASTLLELRALVGLASDAGRLTVCYQRRHPHGFQHLACVLTTSPS
jgi:hypothetical protein